MPDISRHSWFSCFRLILVLALSGFLADLAKGQSEMSALVLPVSVYNVEEGLNQSTVYQVLQDYRGLIWVITGGGIQCFDGSGFRSFDPPDELAFNVSANPMHALAEASPGQMVIASGSALLNFNSKEGRFCTVHQKTYQYPWLFNITYRNLSLCWTSVDGLCMAGDDRLYPVRLDFRKGSVLPRGFNPVNAAMMKDGTLFIASAEGFLRLEPARDARDTAFKADWHPLGEACRWITNGKNGEVLILSGGKISEVSRDGSFHEIFDTGIKECCWFLTDSSGQFWISDAAHRKLYRVSGGKMKEAKIITWDGKHADTLQPAVRTIYEDRRGNLWFGTDGRGLLFYSPGQLMFDMSAIGFTRCIARFEGSTWAGTFNNGLWRISPEAMKEERINPRVFTDDVYILDLYEDGNERLWTATSKGVYIIDKGGSVIAWFPFTTSSANFFRAGDDTLRLSTYDELYCCNTGNMPGLIFSRNQTQVKDVLAYQGSYWVGNHFGLFRRDMSDGLLSALCLREQDKLTPFPVYSLMPSRDSVWAGTGHGIVCFSREGRKLKIPECLEKLKHETIYSLAEDNMKRIWYAGNNGAGCVTAARDHVIRFSRNNNLQSLEFNFNASLFTADGWLYLGGINGINSINTNKIICQSLSPDVCLASLGLSDSAFLPGIPTGNETVFLSWQAPHIHGSVFTPDYLPAGTASYSFFLEGYTPGWSLPSMDPEFSFRNLPPGKYRLFARCADLYGNRGSEKCLLTVVIRPPFWKTWWFATLSSLLLVALIIVIIRVRQEIRYRGRLRELERRNAIDRERLRISQDMHDEIGSSLTQISILSEIAKSQKENPGEMVRLVDRISGISGAVVDDMGEIIWAMNPRNDNLASFTSYLRRHASEYLSTAGIECSIRFPEEAQQVPMTSEQRRNTYLVFKEALHNVVKHSGATRVSLSLSWSDGALEAGIRDDGKGFDPGSSASSGNGLNGMKKRIEVLGGSFSLVSRMGEGTHIRFTVPVSSPKN